MDRIFLVNFSQIYVKKIKSIFERYKLKRFRYRCSLIDVNYKEGNNLVELTVLIHGIKKQTLTYLPNEILYDDELLSEFSACDVRAISYLSFREYFNAEKFSLIIEGQRVKNGTTIFLVKDTIKDEIKYIEAKIFYQNHNYLSRLSKADIINVISTAVQEQALIDFSNMENKK